MYDNFVLIFPTKKSNIKVHQNITIEKIEVNNSCNKYLDFLITEQINIKKKTKIHLKIKILISIKHNYN